MPRISSAHRRRAALIAALGAAGLACGEPAPPDVVVFLIDTLRADRIGAYGHDAGTTPRIDALARESLVFEQASAPAPWTLPSTVSLLTSRLPCEHRVLVDGDRVPPDLPTLAERLRDAGYYTASFYSNAYAGPMTGLERGFATANALALRDGEMLKDWLASVGTQPFFLYVHDVEPHDPYQAPSSESRAVRKRTNVLLGSHRQLSRIDWSAGRPPGTTDVYARQQQVARALDGLRDAAERLYDADVRLADERLGQVVDALSARGRWRNTLFVLVSDHGEEFGERGGWQHDHSLYEELVRVPLLLRLPGGAGGGRRIAAPVSLLDVLPTVLDLVGRPELASDARGRSLLPLAQGEELPAGLRVVSQRVNRKKYYRPDKQARGDLNVALRHGRWKGIWNAEPDTFELYDLAADPNERSDLAARHPERVAAWRAAGARSAENCVPAGAPAAPPALDEATREGLRALGYVD